MNDYFYTGHAYLNVAIQAQNVGASNSFCWFGRLFLSYHINGTAPAATGGIISIITDYRNPATNALNNNYINVEERFDGSGTCALRITMNSAIFAGNLKIKVYG